VQEGSRKAIIAAFLANLGIAIAKFVGFLTTASASLLAEAAHSLADTGNQALLLLGGSRAKRRPTAARPFGHGRERYFWAFVVALVLFSMGGLFALYEGIRKLIHPHETENFGVAVAILVVAIGLETVSFLTAIREARHVKPASMSWWRFIRTSKQPELPVVLLEDIGAEVGLFLALFGVVMGHYTHNARWDAVGSVSIGVLLIVIAIVLASEMKSLLIGESASADDETAIRSALQSHASVVTVIDLRTQHLGPDELLVTAKLEFRRDLAVAELSGTIDDVEAGVRAACPRARFIFIEPDLARGETTR
jgi:cation diffusion facilitator family transporter